MTYSEKVVLLNEYQIWLMDHPTIEDCTYNIINYLDNIGILKEGYDYEEIKKYRETFHNEEYARKK